MTKRLFLLSVILIIMSHGNIYASNINNYKNGNTTNNTSVSKISSYINSKKVNIGGGVYCIGQDIINYYERFVDQERDYFELEFPKHFLLNTQLSENQRQINAKNLQFMYVHEPNIYDNPAQVSGLSGKWFNCGVEWDKDKNKWRLTDNNGLLFEIPTDDKRGQWTIYLKGTDTTGKPLFDKESIGFASFRVHKAPVPKFTFTETAAMATLADAGSYDLDYQYQKPNNGIKQYFWSAKIGGVWIDLGTGKSITFNNNGQEVTDYRLTVEDYDGAFASISKNALIFDKPLVDFEFRVGGNTANYVYKGNAGNETVSVNPLITWNDDAYSPIYATSGLREEIWTAVFTGEKRTGYNLFNSDIMKNNFSGIIQDNIIAVELAASNKYDYEGKKQRILSVKDIQLQDMSGVENYEHCGVTAGTEVRFSFIPASGILKDDISVKITSTELSVTNLEASTEGSQFVKTTELPDIPSLWDKFSYTTKVYSKRTNELLHTVNNEIQIHTPLNLQGFINGRRDEEGLELYTDEVFNITAVTLKYAEFVTITFPVVTTDIITDTVYPANSKIYLNPSTNNTEWSKQLKITGDAVTEDTMVPILFEATAFNGRDKETDDLDFKLVTYRLENFRIVRVRDLRLEDYYKTASGGYADKPKFASDMALDAASFYPYSIDSLTKGYVFEFEIDAVNFNDDVDKIIITPSFYSVTGNYRDPSPKNAYWEDSNKRVWELGSGGHANYGTIVLTKEDRTIIDSRRSIYKGQYFIPGTSFLSSSATADSAKEYDLKSDIIVNFNIEGYKGDAPKYNYNQKRWDSERTIEKFPYKTGDVIRYGLRSNLDDLHLIRVRP